MDFMTAQPDPLEYYRRGWGYLPTESVNFAARWVSRRLVLSDARRTRVGSDIQTRTHL